MTNLILRYRLKAGVTAADFEQWVRTVDHPSMRGLRRVKRFETYKVTGLLMGDGVPSADYIEVFEIDDFAGFGSEDMTGSTVQAVIGAFMTMVDAPEFMVAEAVDAT
jgi:REDY-like protein HapK